MNASDRPAPTAVVSTQGRRDPPRAHVNAIGQARRTQLAAAFGNGLEFFDFTVFSFFSAIIGKLFFSIGSELGGWMLSLATFGVGFVIRPLGSVVIGAYADRVGRKPALLLTVTMMAIGTGMIGLAPPYAAIGWAAPLLIVCGRLLQGFAAGGEVGAATSFLMESASAGKRGAAVSWQMTSQGGAALAGAVIAGIVTRVLPADALLAWGWRLPFLIGLACGPVGFYLRRHLHDTLAASTAHAASADQQPRAKPQETTPRHRLSMRLIAAGTMLVIGGTSTMYTMVFFLPSFLVVSLHMAPALSLMAGCAAGLVLLLGSPFAGRLADRTARRKSFLYRLSIVSLLLAWPAFYLLCHAPSLGIVVAVVIVLVGLMTLSSPAGFVLILESLPIERRATSLGIIYAFGVTLFGGFAQLIVGALYRWSQSFYAPVWYMLGCGVVSLIGLALYPEAPRRAPSVPSH